ncbi:PEP-CTERM sorting domain-containing protein [Mariniblastus sp.]|nr:PEP-CTERM sorting domain-containing protein [Mariniblastus sp.]
MKKTISTLLMSAALCVASTAQADISLQLDFGNAGVFDGLNNETLTPAGISDSTWNGVPNTDITSGLLFGDASAATGVSVELGAAPGGGIIDFTTANARNNAGNTESQGAIYDTTLTDDWVFDSGGRDIGARITGLAPGDYLVYAIAKEPNQLARTYDVGIGAFTNANADNISSSSTELDITSIGDATGTTTFVDGLNFALTRVTIADSTDFIAVLVDPTNGNGEQRFATLSSIQIVAVPEPSSVALLALGSIGMLVRRKRS